MVQIQLNTENKVFELQTQRRNFSFLHKQPQKKKELSDQVEKWCQTKTLSENSWSALH